MNEPLHTLDALINEIDQLLAWGDPSEADPVFQEGRDEGLREARKLIRARRESAPKLSS